MNKLVVVISALGFGTWAGAAEWNLSEKPLEIPQGATPNVVVIMDDSGSMDWEVMTGDFGNEGRFLSNQPAGANSASSGDIQHKRSYTEGSLGTSAVRATCAAAETYNSGDGYIYGVEFSTNRYGDDGKDCNTADEEAWRFRNHDFNPLYYDPDRVYLPWPGLSGYTTVDYPDGVPYSELAEQFIKYEPTASAYTLVGFDNPTKPVEWLDLTVNNTNWESGVGAHTSTWDKDGDGKPDGFSYFLWEDTNGNTFFDNAANGDTVKEVRVNTLPAAEQQNFQNWFNFYRSREFAVKASMHFVLENLNGVRMGYTTINSAAQNLEVALLNPSINAVDGNKYKLLQKIDGTTPNGVTPLRIALRDVGNYFSCSSTNNKFGADTCPYVTVEEGAACQQNYSLLFSDGFWDGGDPGVGDQDSGGGAFAAAAFADAKNTGLAYDNTLADVAMKYYREDLRTDLDNEVFVSVADLERAPAQLTGQTQMHQHMKTYTVAFGLGLESFDSSVFDTVDVTQGIAWPDPQDADPASAKAGKVIDLMHAAFNGRGYFYGTNDDQQLVDSLTDSFSKIQAEQSGAAGVSFNSQELKTGTFIFRAFYNPSTYDGDLVAIPFDNNGVPQVDSPVWSASEQLNNVIADGSRLIVTWDPDTSSGALFDYDAGLTATQQAYFEQDRPATLPVGYGDGDAVIGDERVEFLYGDQSLEGVRFDLGELRDRDGMLGDFANSTPRYVGLPQGAKRDFVPYPTTTGKLYSEFKQAYLGRNELVYAGANDGMLHAFDADNGREIFAFVPNTVMDDLHEYTLPTYLHEMSVDGSPGINDVFINTGAGEEWRTVLMGGLRAGGQGYYALDITDPSTFNTVGMPDNVMWEFTSADDDRLGYSFSTPNIVMSNAKYDNADANHRWISLFGNGYNQSDAAGESALFALFIDAGLDGTWNKLAKSANATTDDYIVMATGNGLITEGATTFPNGLGIPRAIDVDGNGTADYVYAGDLAGNLYRFDISDADPASWSMSEVLFTASFPVNATTNSRQPITVQPVVALNESDGGYLVLFSTGSWMTVDDITSEDIQSIYGIWDDASINYPVLRDDLVEQEYTNAVNQLHGFSYRTLTENPVNYKATGSAGNRTLGWHIDFDICDAAGTTCPEYPGERAIRNLLLKENVVFGATILPTNNAACTDAPGGFLLSLNSQTGGLVEKRPGFDLNNDGIFDEDDVAGNDGTIDADEVPAAIRIDDGLPSDIAIIDGGAADGSQICYQTSTGELICQGANVDLSYPQGRLSWKELAD